MTSSSSNYSRLITIVALTFTTFLLSSSRAQAVRAPPPSVSPLTPEALAEASVNVAVLKAMRARATAARRVYSTHDCTMQHYLGSCRGAYSDALSSLRAAAALLKTTNNRDEINRDEIVADISVAMRSVTSCEENFRGVPGMAFPLRRVNNSLMKMVKNSLAIGSQLK